MTDTAPGRLFGLFIGIDRYESDAISPLAYAGADVTALRDCMVERCGLAAHDGVLLVDDPTAPPTRRHILRAMDRLASAPIQPADAFVFAFAGHGFHCGGRSFLAACDSEISSEAILRETAVGVDTVRSFLDQIPAQQQILILDACRNNPLRGTRSLGADAMSPEMTRDLGALLRSRTAAEAAPVRRSHAVLCSCWEGQVAHEYQPGGHGWFCYNLLAELQQASGQGVSLAELHHRIRERMREQCWRLLPAAKDQAPHLLIDGDVPVLRLTAGGSTVGPSPEPAALRLPRPESGTAHPAPAPPAAAGRLGAVEAALLARQPRAALEALGAVSAPSPRSRVLGCLAQLQAGPIARLRQGDASDLAARLGELAATDQRPLALLLLAALAEYFYRPLKRRFPLPELVADAAAAVRDLAPADQRLGGAQAEVAATLVQFQEKDHGDRRR